MHPLMTTFKWINIISIHIVPALVLIQIVINKPSSEALLSVLRMVDGLSVFYPVQLLLRHHDVYALCKENLQTNFHLEWVAKKRNQIKSDTDKTIRLTFITINAIAAVLMSLWLILPLQYIMETGDRILYLNLWYPFDEFKTPTYEIIFFWEMYCLIIGACVIVNLDMIYFSFVTNLCAQFDYIVEDLARMKKGLELGTSDEYAFVRLKKHVVHHQCIIK